MVTFRFYMHGHTWSTLEEYRHYNWLNVSLTPCDFWKETALLREGRDLTKTFGYNTSLINNQQTKQSFSYFSSLTYYSWLIAHKTKYKVIKHCFTLKEGYSWKRAKGIKEQSKKEQCGSRKFIPHVFLLLFLFFINQFGFTWTTLEIPKTFFILDTKYQNKIRTIWASK